MEKLDLPTGGKPCLLAGSVKELQEEMRHYLSFSDEDVFKSMALPEETSTIPTEETSPQSTRSTPAGTPKEETTVGTAREPAAEKRPPNKFLVGRRCCIPPNPWWLLGRSPLHQEAQD